MAKINRVLIGESLVGDGNEVAHIDLLMGPRGSAAETAFCNALTNNKDGFTSLLAVVAPNLLTKPNTILFNKVTIKGAKQAVQMFGPAQHAVALAVADSVEDGTIPQDEADDLFVCVGVFIHWQAEDDKKIQEYNYKATREAIRRRAEAVFPKPLPEFAHSNSPWGNVGSLRGILYFDPDWTAHYIDLTRRIFTLKTLPRFLGFGKPSAKLKYALQPVFANHGVTWTPPPVRRLATSLVGIWLLAVLTIFGIILVAVIFH